MACRIIRDSEGNIERVENPQGEISQLYSQALQVVGNEQQALEIAYVPYTQQYQDINGVTATDPTLSEVMTFISRNNNQNKSLTKQDIDNLRNNTLSIPFNSIEEMYTKVTSLYPQGIFTVNRATLTKSELYTETEIEALLADSSLHRNIKETADKIIAEVSLNEIDLRQINQNMATYETPDLLSVQDTTNIIGLGKFTQINPFLIDKDLRQRVGGIKNREQFENLLDGANEAIVDQYFTNDEFANKIFETYSSMERMQILEDSGFGGLEYSYPNNIRKFTEQSLIIGESATDLLNAIDLLQSTPRTVWEDNGVEIEDLLLRIEDLSSELGIDTVGITNQSYSFEDIQNYLNSVANLAYNAQYGTVEQAMIEDFSNNYNLIFNQNLQPEYTAIKMNPSNRGKSLVLVDSIKSEQQLFDENSLVKVNNEGVYQRVNRQEDLEGLYDYVTDLVQFNPNIIDKQALFPSAYSNNKFLFRKAVDINNRESIREDIVRYVQQQGYSEDLTLYKIAFGHAINFSTVQKDLQVELNKINSVNRSYEYLTGDFISDFSREYLQQKIEDSELFSKVYNHFKFNERGIVLKDSDPYSKQEINLFTPESHPLRDYAIISKDFELNTLFTTAETQEQPIEEKLVREFYLNNPEQLSQKTVQIELSEDGEYLATQNLEDNYINVNGEVWEKARNYKNLTIYQKLPQIYNPLFSQYNIEVNINTSVNPQQFEGLVQTLENISSIERLYTQKQLEQINSEKEC